MATYISQTVLNQQGGVLLPGQVLDTSISNNTYTQPQQEVQTPQSNPIIAAATQQQSQLTYEQKQQILFQQGLPYGNPLAPEYNPLWANLGYSQTPSPTPATQPIQQPQVFSPPPTTSPAATLLMSNAYAGSITDPKTYIHYETTATSPTQAKAYEIAAQFEQLPVIAQLKGAGEYLSSSSQGTIFEIPVNYFVSPLLRSPEMIGKTGIATAGVLSAAVTGDVAAFQQGVPASRQAFAQAATDPYFYISSALTAGIIYKASYSGNLVKQTTVSSEIQPMTKIMARTETGVGTEFIAKGSDVVAVTSAKTIGGVEIPFTRVTSQYKASLETSGITLKTPEISQTAKLGSAEGQAPMLVQTRAATGIELSQSVKAGFVPEWQTKGLSIKEVTGFKATEGSSVGAAYGEFPSGIPYGEALAITKQPSFETTALNIKYPTLAKGEVYSEISPTYRGVFEPTKSPAQFTSDISSIRAVSSGGKISEISGMFKELTATNERAYYQISLKEGKALTKGIGTIEPGGFRTPIGEGEVFPKMVSPKDVTSFETTRGTTKQLQITKVSGEATKAGTAAIQTLVSEMKSSQKTGTSTMAITVPLKTSTFQTSQEVTQARQTPLVRGGLKEMAISGLATGLKSLTTSISELRQTDTFKSLTTQPTIQPVKTGLRITETTITSDLLRQPTTQFTSGLTTPLSGLPGTPITPISFVPGKPFLGGGLGGLFPSDSGSDLFGKPGKRLKGKYQPSFIALTLGLKTTKTQGLKAEKFGIAVRGIIGRRR